MDSLLNSFNKPSSEDTPHEHKQPSTTELFSSAKYVAEAAKSSFSKESDKVEKAKLADAAADLLDAASHYGKLEEKSFGKYIEKAEDYLHKYNSSQTNSTTTTQSDNDTNNPKMEQPGGGVAGGDGDKKAESGSGFGDYVKMAEGFIKKN